MQVIIFICIFSYTLLSFPPNPLPTNQSYLHPCPICVTYVYKYIVTSRFPMIEDMWYLSFCSPATLFCSLPYHGLLPPYTSSVIAFINILWISFYSSYERKHAILDSYQTIFYFSSFLPLILISFLIKTAKPFSILVTVFHNTYIYLSYQKFYLRITKVQTCFISLMETKLLSHFF